MSGLIPPNYRHYSHVKTILAADAKELLAHFALRVRNISDPDEYERLFYDELPLAGEVLYDAFESKNKDDHLPYVDLGEAKSFDKLLARSEYIFSRIKIRTVDFCLWANKLYKLPDELRSLINVPRAAAPVNSQQVKANNIAPATEDKQQTIRNKGGKPKGTLAEAIEHAYKKLLDQGNLAVLTAGNIRGFIKCLKEMATEGNRNQDKYIIVRIEAVTIPKNSPCTITTRERRIPGAEHGKYLPKKDYKENSVSKLLTKLRKRFPLST